MVRSVCEFTVPYWGPLITKKESARIERIQKTSLHEIFGDKIKNYNEALKTCNINVYFISSYGVSTLYVTMEYNWYEGHMNLNLNKCKMM